MNNKLKTFSDWSAMLVAAALLSIMCNVIFYAVICFVKFEWIVVQPQTLRAAFTGVFLFFVIKILRRESV